ncbi:hypothetical protein CANCADRAFT_2650 [Tortispora caseinolytica NRRL Y-17796]|uniref:AAA+ ATPase domain-containing protein n=1 Tax=Tortispora caseinolytica NRRL Y-17796 TaxID=767744 RepID=A0A1E4TGU0_9ASCO|nr:hypothetical protein CANCADRAFT_2650 [Tortispora caseinolytica NRRL Y-17796]
MNFPFVQEEASFSDEDCKTENRFGINAVRSDGKTFLLRKRENKNFDELRPIGYDLANSDLIREIEDESLARAIQNSEADVNTENSAKSEVSTTLWVDKYRPKKFLDLIGDERSHRYVMRFLRMWGTCVFGLPAAHPKEKKFVRSYKDDWPKTDDPMARPNRRMLLISGSPGLGKTTLAHVAAKQAGYEILEVNASDERNADTANKTVRHALLNNRIGRSGKPVCAIIDEIDGAAESGFIKALLDIIESDKRASDKSGAVGGGKKGQKGKADNTLLRRPIILICNNPYANTLKKLKPHCEHVQYKKTSAGYLLKRLQYICRQEKIKVDVQSLLSLIDSNEGDIRACLNSLQFNQERTSSIQKDIDTSATQIVDALFVKGIHNTEGTETENQALVRRIGACGESDKIIGGLFAQYPFAHYNDDRLNKTIQAGEWVFFYEILNKQIWSNMNFDLLPYTSHAILAWHELFGSITNNLRKPRQEMMKAVAQEKKNKDNIHPFFKDKANMDYNAYQVKQTVLSSNKLFKGALPLRITGLFVTENLRIELGSMVLSLLGCTQPLTAEAISRVARVLQDLDIKVEPYRLEMEDLNETLPCIAFQSTPNIHNFQLFQKCRLILPNLVAIQYQMSRSGNVKRGSSFNEEGVRKSKQRKVLHESSINIQPRTKNMISWIHKDDDEGGSEFGENAYVKANVTDKVWIEYHEGYSNAVRRLISWNQLWGSN